MEIRARPTSLTAMPRRALGVISSRVRWKDHFSISSVSLADLGGKNDRVYIVFLLVLAVFWFDRWPLLVLDDDEHSGELNQLGARSSSI